MAQQVINVGTVANDHTGDSDRASWIKTNANFSELYARPVGSGTVNSGSAGQLAYYSGTGTAVSPLTLGTNLSITGSTLNAASGSGGGTPGGTSGQIQINSSSTFAGITIGAGLTNNSGALNVTGLPNASTSQLYGGTGGVGVAQAITLGTGLSISGTTLNATGGSGSGTVNTGTTGTLAFYAANGTAVSPLTLGTNLSITGTTLNAAGGSSRTIAVGLTAAGTTQGTAYALTADDSVFSTVASGSGAILRTANGQAIMNRGANAVLVYPPTGGTIEGGATNAAVSIPAGGSATFNTADGAAFYAR